jgi:photosystem II stability/assembly factor-like uncharacterized protein
VNSLAVYGTNLFAGTYGGVFLSTDSGTNWTAVKTGLTNSSVQSFAVSGTKVFAGTLGGGVFLSTNDGTNWTAVNNGLTGSYVFALALSGSNLFAGTDGDVFLSTNNGTSWTRTSTGLTSAGVFCFTISGANLFAGTDDGVFLSTNDGNAWTAINAGLTNSFVQTFAIHGTSLFVGTEGGVFSRPLSEMVADVERAEFSPNSFLLEQNFPNPFNPSTTIKYELPRASQVSLSVYDVLGREVSVLVNDRRDAGDYQVKLDGSNLASGVYFYRLQAGDFVATKRLVLLR